MLERACEDGRAYKGRKTRGHPRLLQCENKRSEKTPRRVWNPFCRFSEEVFYGANDGPELGGSFEFYYQKEYWLKLGKTQVLENKNYQFFCFIARLCVWSSESVSFTHVFRNEFALVAAIVKEVTRLLPSSRRMRRRRRLGIGEVFIRALTATFLFALFISPMRRTPDVNFLKIGNLLVGFPFLVVVLHKILC